MDGIDQLLQTAYRAESEGFVPFSVAGQVVGWMRPAFAGELAKFGKVFEQDQAGAVRLREDLHDEPSRSSAVAPVVRELARQGTITGWRNELYPVRSGLDAEGTPLMHLERAAARPFGITSYAVHVNGVVEPGNGRDAPSLWIGRRSMVKPIDPGMLDNLVGGGVPSGFGVPETLVKEAWEEAGLGATLASKAVPGRHVRIRRVVPEGMQSEVVFVHDLALPPEMIPRNQDGEVGEFTLLSAPAVIELLRSGGRMTADASLVTLDWLDRRGLLKLPDTRQVRAIFGGWSTRTRAPSP